MNIDCPVCAEPVMVLVSPTTDLFENAALAISYGEPFKVTPGDLVTDLSPMWAHMLSHNDDSVP